MHGDGVVAVLIAFGEAIVLEFEGGEIGDVVTNAESGVVLAADEHIGLSAIEERIGVVGVFPGVTEIGAEFSEGVGQLRVKARNVKDAIANRGVANDESFIEPFEARIRVDDIGVHDRLMDFREARAGDVIVIERKTWNEAGEGFRMRGKIDVERFSLVAVNAILRGFGVEEMRTSIADFGDVMETEAAGWNIAVHGESNFLQREKAVVIVEAQEKGAADGSGEPLDVMEGGVVIADVGVVAADAESEMIVEFVLEHEALEIGFDDVVGLREEENFAEDGGFIGEARGEEEIERAEKEGIRAVKLIGGLVADVTVGVEVEARGDFVDVGVGSGSGHG